MLHSLILESLESCLDAVGGQRGEGAREREGCFEQGVHYEGNGRRGGGVPLQEWRGREGGRRGEKEGEDERREKGGGLEVGWVGQGSQGRTRDFLLSKVWCLGVDF